MCINCDLKDKLFAPFGGLISSAVANGDKATARPIFKAIAIRTLFVTIITYAQEKKIDDDLKYLSTANRSAGPVDARGSTALAGHL